MRRHQHCILAGIQNGGVPFDGLSEGKELCHGGGGEGVCTRTGGSKTCSSDSSFRLVDVFGRCTL